LRTRLNPRYFDHGLDEKRLSEVLEEIGGLAGVNEQERQQRIFETIGVLKERFE
jgi:hypothetical protein